MLEKLQEDWMFRTAKFTAAETNQPKLQSFFCVSLSLSLSLSQSNSILRSLFHGLGKGPTDCLKAQLMSLTVNDVLFTGKAKVKKKVELSP
jgi:hypothetical protein